MNELKENKDLILIDKSFDQSEIEKIDSIDESKAKADQYATLLTYAKKISLGREKINILAEEKIRYERQTGRLIPAKSRN